MTHCVKSALAFNLDCARPAVTRVLLAMLPVRTGAWRQPYPRFRLPATKSARASTALPHPNEGQYTAARNSRYPCRAQIEGAEGSLCSRAILKLTFLFLANFVQSFLSPTGLGHGFVIQF